MTNRVNVNITARDLTRNALNSLSRNFRNVGQDMDRFLGQRTRVNFQRLSQSVQQARRDLQQLRGNIPDAEFFRLDRALLQSQNRMARGFRALRNNQQMLRRIRNDLDDFATTFNRVASSGQIRIRPDRTTVRVPVRPDTRGFGRTLLRQLTAPMRLVTGLISGTLQDGIGQGIVQGVRSAGPVVGSIFVAAILAALSALGAAIAGALVLILGGAVAGLGIFLAAQSTEVRKAWSKTLKEIQSDWSKAAEPMLPVIEFARQRLLAMSNDFVPHFRNALVEMQGPLQTFIGHFERGFRKVLDIAGPDLKEAFNTFLIAFGPEFEGFMESMGESLGALARTVRDNSTEIAMGLRAVLEIINLIIDTINFFARAWAAWVHGFLALTAAVADAYAWVAEQALNAFGRILQGAETSMGWVPGIGEKIKGANRAFQEFKDQAVEDLNATGERIRGLSATIKAQNEKNKLTADISALESKVKDAKQRLQTVTDKKVKAQIKAEIKQLQNQIEAAKRKLNSINGKTATTYVVTQYIHRPAPGDANANGIPDLIERRAMGGIIGAATGGVRSNLTMVGEHGPELVNLPAGSRVRSNPDTRRMMSGGGGLDTGPIQVTINVDGRVLAQAMVEPTRNMVRTRSGGNVQRFFGQEQA